MKFHRAGSEALLVELDAQPAVHALHAELQRRAPPGLVEIVPAARTILLVGSNLDRLRQEIAGWPLQRVAQAAGPRVEIPVIYDGPDLGEVANLCGLSVREIIQRHSATEYAAAFCGFVPGFAYLTGLPPELQVARRRQPRTRVEAGSIGLAGEYTGVYPRATPGGWQLIGRTSLTLWDTSRDPPALLAPGTRVRFVEAET